jgi:multiple sugar transport system permease protein
VTEVASRGEAIGQSVAAPQRRRGSRLRRSQLRTAVLFLAPAVLAIVLLRLVPFGEAIWNTLLKSEGFGLLAEEKFAGLDNYVTLFSDASYLKTLLRTIVFNLIINPLQIALAMAVSVLMTRKLYGRGIWRTAVFLPSTIPLVGSSVAWGIALRPDGPVNALLNLFGIGSQPFFTSSHQALASIILVASWVGIGHWMIFLIGGLNSVSEELYEAASIDGANAWRSFWSVTVPLMRRPLLFVLVADTVANFVLFVPMQMLTDGGPESSTTVMMFDVYQRTYTFSEPHVGAAATVVLTVIMIIVVSVQFRLLGERSR